MWMAKGLCIQDLRYFNNMLICFIICVGEVFLSNSTQKKVDGIGLEDYVVLRENQRECAHNECASVRNFFGL